MASAIICAPSLSSGTSDGKKPRLIPFLSVPRRDRASSITTFARCVLAGATGPAAWAAGCTS